MEEENKKARRVVRKEYNDTIRELVAFMRKRVREHAARVSVTTRTRVWCLRLRVQQGAWLIPESLVVPIGSAFGSDRI